MSIDNSWDVKIVKPLTGDVANRLIHFDPYKIFINPNDIILKYK